MPEDPQFERRPEVGVEPPHSLEPVVPRPPTNRPPEWFPVPPVPSPPRDPVWSGGDVVLIALLTIVTLVAAELVVAAGAWAFFYRNADYRSLLQRPSLDLLGQVLGYVAVAAFMIFLVEGKYRVPFWKAIHWNWNPRSIPKWLGLGVLTVGIDLLGRYLPLPKSSPFEQFFAHRSDALLMAIFAVTFGPLMEELIFRGFLYPVLARWTGVTTAVLLTAIAFGLLHYLQYRSWSAVLLITLVGVVLTVVRAWTNSVSASFLVHVGYNGTLMALAAVATDGFRHMEKAALVWP